MKLSNQTKELTGHSRAFEHGGYAGEIVWFKDDRYHTVNFADGSDFSAFGYRKQDWEAVILAAITEKEREANG